MKIKFVLGDRANAGGGSEEAPSSVLTTQALNAMNGLSWHRLGDLPQQVRVVGNGFDDVETDTVDFAFHAASLDEFWEQAIRRSGRFSAIVARLEPAEHYKLRDAVDEAFAPYVHEDGSVEIPARALVAAAGA